MLQSQAIIKFLTTYKYLALFPLACIEGPIIALVVGFLTRLGYLNFLLAFSIMILGDFIPDTIYYSIGYFGNRNKIIEKYDTKSKIISRHMMFLNKMWSKHTVKTMFMSKLAYGISTPLLVSAGVVHLSYKKFIWPALYVTIFQYGVIMAVGYYLGNSYGLAENYIIHTTIIVAVLAGIFIAVYFIMQKYVRNKFIQMEEQEEKYD